MFNVKITGLDKLQRELEEAQRAFQALDGEITQVRFDPESRDSVEAAVRQMEQAVDAKVHPYRGNALVSQAAAGLKAKYRDQILARAEAAKTSP